MIPSRRTIPRPHHSYHPLISHIQSSQQPKQNVENAQIVQQQPLRKPTHPVNKIKSRRLRLLLSALLLTIAFVLLILALTHSSRREKSDEFYQFQVLRRKERNEEETEFSHFIGNEIQTYPTSSEIPQIQHVQQSQSQQQFQYLHQQDFPIFDFAPPAGVQILPQQQQIQSQQYQHQLTRNDKHNEPDQSAIQKNSLNSIIVNKLNTINANNNGNPNGQISRTQPIESPFLNANSTSGDVQLLQVQNAQVSQIVQNAQINQTFKIVQNIQNAEKPQPNQLNQAQNAQNVQHIQSVFPQIVQSQVKTQTSSLVGQTVQSINDVQLANVQQSASIKEVQQSAHQSDSLQIHPTQPTNVEKSVQTSQNQLVHDRQSSASDGSNVAQNPQDEDLLAILTPSNTHEEGQMIHIQRPTRTSTNQTLSVSSSRVALSPEQRQDAAKQWAAVKTQHMGMEITFMSTDEQNNSGKNYIFGDDYAFIISTTQKEHQLIRAVLKTYGRYIKNLYIFSDLYDRVLNTIVLKNPKPQWKSGKGRPWALPLLLAHIFNEDKMHRQFYFLIDQFSFPLLDQVMWRMDHYLKVYQGNYPLFIGGKKNKKAFTESFWSEQQQQAVDLFSGDPLTFAPIYLMGFSHEYLDLISFYLSIESCPVLNDIPLTMSALQLCAGGIDRSSIEYDFFALTRYNHREKQFTSSTPITKWRSSDVYSHTTTAGILKEAYEWYYGKLKQ